MEDLLILRADGTSVLTYSFGLGNVKQLYAALKLAFYDADNFIILYQ